MDIFKSLKSSLFDINPSTFNNHAIRLFQFQLVQNSIYRRYVESLGIDPAKVTDFQEIPFLPIQLFKQYSVKSGNWEPEVIFESSGTTSTTTSMKKTTRTVERTTVPFPRLTRGTRRRLPRLRVCAFAETLRRRWPSKTRSPAPSRPTATCGAGARRKSSTRPAPKSRSS